MADVRYHTVREGDTLWGICRKYYGDGSAYQMLADANEIANPDLIKVGQKVAVPPMLMGPAKIISSKKSHVIHLDPLPLVCECAEPQENYPYDEQTFKMIEKLKDIIIKLSEEHDVPPVAVAGSIADEYNTRRGARAALDWLQDDVFIEIFPNFAFKLDAMLGGQSKLTNVNKNDLGIGNIKLETAKKIYEEHKDEFEHQDWDYRDIVDYLKSDEGTVHLAALVIQRAKEVLGDEIWDYPACRQEAVLVTFYKQGEEKYVNEKWKPRKAADPEARIRPGEGCRVCLQRDKFLKALGLDE